MSARVVVVGAGASGLMTARELADRDVEVTVLEATPHIGGRTRTTRLVHDEPADLGGSFIDEGQHRILRTCQRYGLALTPRISLFPHLGEASRSKQADLLRNHFLVNGTSVSKDVRENLASEIEAALEAVPPSRTESLTAWAKRAELTSPAASAFRTQAGVNPMCDPDLLQVKVWHPPELGHLCWMLEHGSDSVSRQLASGLDVRLGQPVRLITEERGCLRVETDADVHRCTDVVVTTSVAASLKIGFDPPLPDWKLNALLSTKMADGAKVVGQYTAGRRLVDLLASGVVTDGPIAYIWSRPVGPEDTVLLLGLAPGHRRRSIDSLLPELDNIVRAIAGSTPSRIAGVVQDWSSEEFFGGVVSLPDAHLHQLTPVLAAPVGNIHFAGEATAETWTVSMEGALRSGERVAQSILSETTMTA